MNTIPHRRIQDNAISKNPVHKLNLERRLKNNERRGKSYFNYIYTGPARRLIIDRRVKAGNRRKTDEDEAIIF
ncbi:MAG: hypothetical protein OEY43_09200 [Gammaproteobacteria bacterium]|nr:hypothetical protein [Gammaproteobacteria bacterium]